MRLPSTVAAALAVVALAGCGDGRRKLSDACTESPAKLLAALRGAPGHVALRDGTLLSECVSAAFDDVQLQNVGTAVTTAASDLARRAARDPGAALRLGFLIGAVERGSARTAGLQAELANRVRSFVDESGARGAQRVAMRRGRAAGRAHG